ncbi:hypothetical protein BSL78_20592 [Apostichopus japonicus]|uniref:Uncharacterized protein n=1 Tax=Stichopus japonicus TaxID=307972 RepID=A0A2G8K3I5_STIJA|nr:hypothetical protein BSL78_20592 [Apostichopus japonicus]
MEKYSVSAIDQSDAKYGFSGTTGQFSRGQEVASLIHQVEELHTLNESAWSFRQYKKQFGAPACKGSYNSERKMMRLKIDITAPLEKVLVYLLTPPFGFRNMLERDGGNTQIVERLGGGAIVAYKDIPAQVLCCCNVAARDSLVLAAVKIPTSNVAIAGIKSIEHPSHPPKDDAYRIDIPLAGLYLEQEGDVVHVEEFVSEIDVKGKIGKRGPGSQMQQMVRRMIALGRAIPRMQDVVGQPPYMQFM